MYFFIAFQSKRKAYLAAWYVARRKRNIPIYIACPKQVFTRKYEDGREVECPYAVGTPVPGQDGPIWMEAANLVDLYPYPIAWIAVRIRLYLGSMFK